MSRNHPPLSPIPTAQLTMPSRPPTRTSMKPWHHHLTLDLILYILSRSVFHPAITFIAYLCIAAMHKHRTSVAYGTLYYTAALLAWRFIGLVNERVTYGPRRDVDWGNEVVVITGGGAGLGRRIAETLLGRFGNMHARKADGVEKPAVEYEDSDDEDRVKGWDGRGVRIAIIDISEPSSVEDREWVKRWDGQVWWGCCDVRNSGGVRIMAGRIKEELGKPTILINNAATSVVGLPLIPEDYSATLTPQEATKTLTVNTIAHFNMLSAMLYDLTSAASGSTIVTISSLLAHLSPSRLPDYSASKAALSSLHNSLTHEVANNEDVNVRNRTKTVLVEPGMMHTQLFADITKVPWYANFFGPVLEVDEVANAIVRQLDRGQSGVIRMPFYSQCMPWYSVMPGMIQQGMRWFSGIDRAIVVDQKERKRRA